MFNSTVSTKSRASQSFWIAIEIINDEGIWIKVREFEGLLRVAQRTSIRIVVTASFQLLVGSQSSRSRHCVVSFGLSRPPGIVLLAGAAPAKDTKIQARIEGAEESTALKKWAKWWLINKAAGAC